MKGNNEKIFNLPAPSAITTAERLPTKHLPASTKRLKFKRT